MRNNKHEYATKNIKYVSFDIYDTLIKRSVLTPKDIFVYVKRKCDLFKIPCPENFVELRIKADFIAQEKFDYCATINEIYAELERMCQSQTFDKVKKIEIDLEMENAVYNLKILKKYKHFVKVGIPIIFISDKLYIVRSERSRSH